MARSSPSTAPDLGALTKGRVPRDVRQEHLLDVAGNVFGALGFHGASLEGVARQAGVSRQYVAKLFGDKEGLYVACHERARRQLDTALQGAGAAAPAAPASTDDALLETVRSVAEAYFRFVAEQGTSWDVLFGGGPGVAGAAAAKIADMRTRTIGLLVAFVTTAIPAVSDDDALFAAEAMSGAAEQHARRLRRDGEDPAASAQRLAELFYRGLAGLRS